MNKLLLAMALFLAAPPLHGQTPPAPPANEKQAAADKPDDVLARARQLYAEQGAKDALPEFERALTLYRAAGERRGEAITIGLIGNCHKKLGDFTRAQQHLERALAMKRELRDRFEEGVTLSHIGLLYYDMGEFPKAIEPYQKAIAIGQELNNPRLEGSARNNLGLIYDELGDYRRSLEEYRRALELYRGTSFERGISDTLGNLGGTHLLLGQYNEALRYHREAFALSEKIKSKPGMTLDLINMAHCHLGLGQVDEAVSNFDRAIGLARETGTKKDEADALKGKGSALTRLGKYAAALELYGQAIGVYEKAGIQQPLVEALGDLGALHLLLGDVPSAEKDFRRALELSRTLQHPRGVTQNLLALGNIESRRQRFEQAGALYRDALNQALAAEDRATSASARIQLAATYSQLGRPDEAMQEAREAEQTASAAGSRPLEAQARYAQAEVLHRRGRAQDALARYAAAEEILRSAPAPELAWRVAFGSGQALEDLARHEEALEAYRRAVQTIEDLRSQLREERFRSAFLDDKYQVYVALVELLLKLGRPEEAFTYSEKLRARSFLDLISRGAPPIRNEAQRQKETALRERIRMLQREIERETSKPAPQQKRQALELFSVELAEAERAYQNLLDDLMRSDPGFAGANALAVPESREVQALLPGDTALIEYVVGEQEISIFILRKGRLATRSVPQRAAGLLARIELLRGLLARERGEEWRAPAESLYGLLIRPLEGEGLLEGVKRLYLVPHGILHYVPFAALPSDKGPASRLLIERYGLAYLPAAAALKYGAGGNGSGKSVLAMAPSRTRLQFTQEEARSVAASFAGPQELLVGARATEASFKRLAGRFDVLHLATHGYFNKINPLLSGVELEPGAEEDGQLEVHEILSMKLRAHLVTLSACETALGGGYFSDVPAGDDLVGLTRAFLFAGSPTVLASLWDVNDRSTLRLMRGFYQQLGAKDKAEALASAQRAMRHRGGRYAHPYYWSAFVLVGRME